MTHWQIKHSTEKIHHWLGMYRNGMAKKDFVYTLMGEGVGHTYARELWDRCVKTTNLMDSNPTLPVDAWARCERRKLVHE